MAIGRNTTRKKCGAPQETSATLDPEAYAIRRGPTMRNVSRNLSMIALCSLAISLQPALCQAPTKSQTAVPNPSDLAESIRQAVTRVVAYGEFARTCNAQLGNDQSQIHDLESRIRDSNDRLTDLSTEATRINAHAPVDVVQLNKLKTQYSETQNLLKTQTDQRVGLYADLTKQQKCIDDAKAQLASLITNPAEPSTSQKDRQK